MLLAPWGLAALLALGVPLLLHLVRRSQLIDTPFAALRWIPAHALPRRRLRFERPWLLLLRLLLLALLALLLARLVLGEDRAAPAGDWVLVAPGADLAAARRAVADAGEWHWLAPGFPAIEATPTPGPTASLLREFDQRAAPDVVLRVVVPQILGGLDGQRLELVHAVDWIVVPGATPVVPAAAAPPITVHLRHAPQDDAALRYAQALVAAWNRAEPVRYTLDAQPLAAGVPPERGWLLWLGGAAPAALARWVEEGGVALVAPAAASAGEVSWRAGDGSVLARTETRGAGRLITLPGAFTPAGLPWLLDADFPQRLLAALRGARPAPTRAAAAQVAPLRRAADARGAVPDTPRDTRPLDLWLALAAAALFVLERLLATRAPGGATR